MWDTAGNDTCFFGCFFLCHVSAPLCHGVGAMSGGGVHVIRKRDRRRTHFVQLKLAEGDKNDRSHLLYTRECVSEALFPRAHSSPPCQNLVLQSRARNRFERLGCARRGNALGWRQRSTAAYCFGIVTTLVGHLPTAVL